MRWRVGRNLTWRNMAFTSCHGQPLSAERSGPEAAAGLEGEPAGRDWFIATLTADLRRQCKSFNRKIYDRVAEMQLLRNYHCRCNLLVWKDEARRRPDFGTFARTRWYVTNLTYGNSAKRFKREPRVHGKTAQQL
jgi:hypothetical protein